MGRDETGLLLTLSNTGGALNSKWQQPLDHNPNSTSIDTAGLYVTAADGHPVGTPGKFYLFKVLPLQCQQWHEVVGLLDQ